MINLVQDMITEAFEEKAGKWQEKKASDDEKMALIVSFDIKTDYSKEEGYRYADLVIYGDRNYVGVWTRTRHCVIPLEYLEDDGDGGVAIKEGHDYDEGASEWECIGYHDSCWRDSVNSFLRKYQDEITGFDTGYSGKTTRTMPKPQVQDKLHLDLIPKRN